MVLRLTSLAALALAGTIQAQEPVKLPVTQPPTTKQAPTTQGATTKQAPTKQAPTKQAPTKQAPTKQAPTTVPAKGAPTTSTKAPSTSGKAPSTSGKAPSTKQAATTVPGSKIPVMAPTKRGWLGFRTDPNDSEIILEVAPGSPAERAGMRPGDRIVSSDRLVYSVTRADSTSSVSGLSRYYVSGPIMGATYRMTLARGDETLDISMIAVAPPEYQRTLLRPTRAAGTVADTLSAEVEAFRTELARTTLQPTRKPLAMTPRKSDTLWTSADSLAMSKAYVRDQAMYDEMLRQTTELSATLKAMTPQGSPGRVIESPELYEDLKRTLQATDLTVKLLATRTNAISGAELEQLNPALGYYFGGVTEGVFVLRVSAESPAAIAGLEPGDIVERVNGEPVATIASLRDHVAKTAGTITLEVIRKGRPATVTLRKE